MPRFFVELAYNGTRFCGWQAQNNQITVQKKIEEAFTVILQREISVTGCGRTDSGVHASQYFLHFDNEEVLPKNFLSRANKMIGKDIGFFHCFEVPDDWHSRFSVLSREYTYHISIIKSPMNHETVCWLPWFSNLNPSILIDFCQILKRYSDFYPFCKANSDVEHYRCELYEISWNFNEYSATFTIKANRFLRGMVRLIIGSALQCARGKMKLEEIDFAMKNQKSLSFPWAVPAHGLRLSEVLYPTL